MNEAPPYHLMTRFTKLRFPHSSSVVTAWLITPASMLW